MAKRTECPVCGLPMWLGAGQSSAKCCNKCRRSLTRDEKVALGIVTPRPVHNCERCGKEFTSRREDVRFCSPKCVAGPRDPFKNQRNMASKRARKRAAFVETVDPATLFERDGWRCHICGRKVRRGVDGFNPLAATIDHIIPLSRGGEHSYRNTACAHRVCNMRKGANDVGSQLALLG